MLTIHSAAPNTTKNLLRLSVDFRYTGESHVIEKNGSCLTSMIWGKPFRWEILEKDGVTAQQHIIGRVPEFKNQKQRYFGSNLSSLFNNWILIKFTSGLNFS
ncbi:MAG: hypothetical protein CM1200mP30_02580 [Pseudomonadota bacterium]|nr:MAG: hypothetical protein CM1200mP30_02580 [Pseudomonadota bacterium]